MTIEALYYSEMSRLGRAPKIKHFAQRDLADKTLPSLAYGQAIGACGYRSVRDPDGGIWYWPRKSADWWIVPDALETTAQNYMNKAISAASDARGQSTSAATASVLREQLAEAGATISIMDTRLRQVLFPLPAENNLPAALNKRLDTLIARRNVCEDWEVDQIDFELIEIALEIRV